MLSTLELLTLQMKLYQASFSKNLRTKQDALAYYKSRIGRSLDARHEAIFEDISQRNGLHPSGVKISFYNMGEVDIDLHLKSASELLDSEIQKRSYDLNQYRKAEELLFSTPKVFSRDEVLYSNKKNETLSVDDLLIVSKYSIALAEMIDPDDKNKELASASITVFQCIEAVLNNQQKAIPTSKTLHIANGFLSAVAKATVKDSDTKKGITIGSTLIDLVIDFFGDK